MELNKRRTAKIVVCILLVLVCLLSIILPLPFLLLSRDEQYDCTWQDGVRTTESYASAFSALHGVDGEGIRLLRDGKTGIIALGETAKGVFHALNSAPLAELLRLDGTGLSRIEHAAIFSQFEHTIFYDGDSYAWTGNKLERTQRTVASEIILLSGELPSDYLKTSGASKLCVRADAVLRAKAFVGCTLTQVEAEPPYEVLASGVYLNTVAGRRLIAALPNVTSFAAECDFADYQSLAACTSLQQLTLPFGGTSRYPSAEDYVGEISVLFGSRYEQSRVPVSLKSITVTGGSLVSYAFYGCDGLEEVITCQMTAQNISNAAFASVPSLKRVHTPNANILLPEEFKATRLSCGCTLFERKEKVVK